MKTHKCTTNTKPCSYMLFLYPQASQRNCFDVYLVRFEEETSSEGSGPYDIESDWIIPSLNVSDVGDGKMTLNVTTNSTLNTNKLYQATLITTMDMMEAGSFQFCKKWVDFTGDFGMNNQGKTPQPALGGSGAYSPRVRKK